MSILDGLSSSLGARSEAPNLQAAARCLAQPALLKELAAGLSGPDAALAGDCAEVLTHVAETRPDLVAPLRNKSFPCWITPPRACAGNRCMRWRISPVWLRVP